MLANAQSGTWPRGRGGASIYDVQHGLLWDSVRIGVPGCPLEQCHQVDLFQYPLGSTPPWETSQRMMTETNMCNAGRLDAPEQFQVRRVLFTFGRGAREEDLFDFAETTFYRFQIGMKFYTGATLIALPTVSAEVKAPIRTCDFCRAVYCNHETCPGCGARSFSLSTIGTIEPGRQFVHELLSPLELENQLHFAISLQRREHFRPRAPFTIFCHLEGMHARGVQ